MNFRSIRDKQIMQLFPINEYKSNPWVLISFFCFIDLDVLLGIMLYGIFILYYTGEPIYSYMIGKDAHHNQVLISQNDHL